MAIDMNKGMRPNLYELLEAGIYELPPANTTELGGVIIGEGVNVDENGVISVTTSTAAYTKAETDALLAERDVEIESNATAISDETTARQAADYDMQTAIDANTAAITAEETARANADADLQSQIDNLPSVDAYTKVETDALLAARDTEIDANAAAITAEETARTNADTAMQADIDANAAAITAEETARTNADTAMQANIDANAAAITAEETARTNADTAMQADIDANAAAITAEETARTNADTDLQTQIDANAPIIIDVNEQYSYSQLERWAKTGHTYIKDGVNIYPVIDYFYYEGEGDNRFYTLETDSGKCYEYFFTDGTFNTRYTRNLITIDTTPTTGSTNAVSSGGVKTYIDGLTGDLTSLTTEDKTNLVAAVNEVYEKTGEPFRVKNWAGTFNLALPYCTEDIANTSIPKAEFTIDDTEGALYQIVGMIAYEVFDAPSGGNRINCWPVCQFTGNGQKTLTVRFMCAGTTRKTAQRINAWVLLKRRA